MNDLELVILCSLLSGSTVFIGGVLSHFFGDHFKNGLIKAEIIHLSIAFGGGIIYLIFQDIEPMSKQKKNWIPALGGSLGFMAGIIGEKVLG